MIIDTDNITPDQLTALRNLVFGDNASLDADGNLSVAGNFSSDRGAWLGKHAVLQSVTVAELPSTTLPGADQPNPDSYGLFLVSDALSPVKGLAVAGGSNTPTLVLNDGTTYRVL